LQDVLGILAGSSPSFSLLAYRWPLLLGLDYPATAIFCPWASSGRFLWLAPLRAPPPWHAFLGSHPPINVPFLSDFSPPPHRVLLENHFAQFAPSSYHIDWLISFLFVQLSFRFPVLAFEKLFGPWHWSPFPPRSSADLSCPIFFPGSRFRFYNAPFSP